MVSLGGFFFGCGLDREFDFIDSIVWVARWAGAGFLLIGLSVAADLCGKVLIFCHNDIWASLPDVLNPLSCLYSWEGPCAYMKILNNGSSLTSDTVQKPIPFLSC